MTLDSWPPITGDMLVGSPFDWSPHTTFLVTVATVLALACYYHQRSTRESWTDYGVKEPKLPVLFALGQDFRSNFSQLLNQYGDVVGFRNRSQLTLLTSNLNLLRHILVKDFNNFVERSENMVSKSPFAKSLFFAKQNDWKRHRQLVSPTFSSGKMRHIAITVDQSAQSLTKYLTDCAKSGKTVPIKEIASQYAGEIVAKTAFGLDVSFVGQGEHEFLYHAKTMVHVLLRTQQMIFILLNLIPYAWKICRTIFQNVQFFDPISLAANIYFKAILNDAIYERKKVQQDRVKKRHPDVLDMLLKANDAAKQGKTLDKYNDDEEDHAETRKAWEGVVTALSDDEVLGHSMLIIFGGIETTATTLQLCLCQLALNQNVQDRAYQEIQSVVSSEAPSTKELGNLHYIEQVINETLRMYPPVPIVSRKAMETRTYEGVTIPKGASIIVPFYHIMSDPKIYPDPMTFDPDRFLPAQKDKRDPLAFLPFGQGPRQCLGMRMAYLELKMALAQLLRKVKVVLNENTEPKLGKKLELTTQGFLTPVKPIKLAFELRG